MREQRLPIRFFSLFDPAAFAQQIAEVVVRLGKLRVHGERCAIGRLRFVEAALFMKHDAEVVVRVDVVRAKCERHPVRGLGRVMPSETVQHDPAIAVDIGVIGAYRGKPPVNRFRFGKLIEGREHRSEPQIRVGEIRLRLNAAQP
ncbi:hypothetical protein OKW39_002528 [Paraburkholderia sp. MM6662-R1]